MARAGEELDTSNQSDNERILLLKSIYIVLTLILRVHIYSTAPVNTIFRIHVWPVYLMYITMTCFVFALAIKLSDIGVVVHHMLLLSTFFATYDACFYIYQSLFDVFLRTGVATLIIVIIQRSARFMSERCCKKHIK